MTQNQYGSNWKDIRRKILERDEFTCSSCGQSGIELIVHHDRPLSMGGTNDEKNLWAICRKCHSVIHSEIDRVGIDEFLMSEDDYAAMMEDRYYGGL